MSYGSPRVDSQFFIFFRFGGFTAPSFKLINKVLQKHEKNIIKANTIGYPTPYILPIFGRLLQNRFFR